MASLSQVQEMWRNFTDDRPVMSKRNKHDWHTYSLLRREVDEAEAETDPEKIATELSDILLFVLTIANNHGIDMDEAVREKIARDLAKYPAINFQGELVYDEAIGKSKTDWVDIRGEEDFYR